MASALLPWLADGLVLLSAITTSVAIYGLIRLPDIYTRIHAASKVAVLGVIPILVASLSTGDWSLILRAALIATLLILTTPVAAHAIARAASLEGAPAASVDRSPSMSAGLGSVDPEADQVPPPRPPRPDLATGRDDARDRASELGRERD